MTDDDIMIAHEIQNAWRARGAASILNVMHKPPYPNLRFTFNWPQQALGQFVPKSTAYKLVPPSEWKCTCGREYAAKSWLPFCDAPCGKCNGTLTAVYRKPAK